MRSSSTTAIAASCESAEMPQTLNRIHLRTERAVARLDQLGNAATMRRSFQPHHRWCVLVTCRGTDHAARGPGASAATGRPRGHGEQVCGREGRLIYRHEAEQSLGGRYAPPARKA